VPYCDGLRLDLNDGAWAQMTILTAVGTCAPGPDRFRLDLQIHPGGTLDSIPPDQVRECTRIWHAQPFSAREIASVAAELPLMTGVVTAVDSTQPLSQCAVMITGHFLSDLIHLVDCAVALGANYRNITVLKKDYSYRLRHRVDAHLRSRGVHVRDCADAGAAVSEHTDRAVREGLRCLALDDGGYVLPVLVDLPTHLQRQWLGVVEQTMSGIYRIENRLSELPVPVFSVAQSRLKGRLESYWIADKAVSTALDLLPPIKIEGQPALVIGYGQVGEQIAASLRRRRMRVAVHDHDILRLIAAHEHGYPTALELVDLLEHHAPLLIFGATGRTSMSAPHFRALHRNCFLVSTTSRDTEFDLPALREFAVAGQESDADGICHRLPDGNLVTVLAEGRPVNFYETDSISNLHSDLVYAGMLVGARSLAEPATAPAPGLDPVWADSVLEESGLLEDYYRRYGPRPERSQQTRCETTPVPAE
jgi:S-adenosylhomocysteine hydrolase